MIEKFRLKELRIERKLSQNCLAKYLNVSQSTIFKWENQYLLPNIDQTIAIIKFFNVTIDYLVGFSDDKHKTRLAKRQIKHAKK